MRYSGLHIACDSRSCSKLSGQARDSPRWEDLTTNSNALRTAKTQTQAASRSTQCAAISVPATGAAPGEQAWSTSAAVGQRVVTVRQCPMAKKRRPLGQQDLNASGAQAHGTEALRIIENLELEGECAPVARLWSAVLLRFRLQSRSAWLHRSPSQVSGDAAHGQRCGDLFTQ